MREFRLILAAILQSLILMNVAYFLTAILKSMRLVFFSRLIDSTCFILPKSDRALLSGLRRVRLLPLTTEIGRLLFFFSLFMYFAVMLC